MFLTKGLEKQRALETAMTQPAIKRQKDQRFSEQNIMHAWGLI